MRRYMGENVSRGFAKFYFRKILLLSIVITKALVNA